jgi:NADPH:quinone reductase-like Zn-dependent oxidoreductase
MSVQKAVIFERFGEPAEVLHVAEVPVRQPARNEVRVRMLASPINPSDLMVVRGRYGRLPQLPATPGFEGAGVVEAVGGGLLARLRGLAPGKRVAVLNGAGGNWQQTVVLPVRQVVPVPADLPDEQVATFFVNPASAFVMTRHVLKVPHGDWLLQTAANSALGRMVIRLGKRFGFRTINVVRRRELEHELLEAGGDAVICFPEDSIEERVRQITLGDGVPYAIDAVGGTTTLEVVKALGSQGRLLVYGTLAGEPVPLDTRRLMVGQKRIEGFWLSEWVRQQGVLNMLRLFRQIARMMREGLLQTKVAASFGIEEIATAVREAETPGRAGKILLRPNPS